MEKYRKWTDEATGINPFIVADQKKFNILYNISTIIKSLLVFIVVITLSPIIILASILPLLSFIHKIVLLLCGNILQYDDNKFTNDLNKLMKKNAKIILSNYSSVMDPFYFMYRIPAVQFLVIHESESGEQSYSIVKGVGCVMKVMTRRQPFFDQSSTSGKQTSLKKLIQQHNASPIVIFYEGIRTNGLGMIKMSKALAQKLNEVQKDYMVCKMSYTPRDQLFYNLVRSPFFNFWRSLGSFSKRTLKVRSQITDISGIHNPNELKKDVDSFMANNGSKLLETSPKDYDSFIDFFYKTQKSNYVHESK